MPARAARRARVAVGLSGGRVKRRLDPPWNKELFFAECKKSYRHTAHSPLLFHDSRAQLIFAEWHDSG
jgi:hypothetical protein